MANQFANKFLANVFTTLVVFASLYCARYDSLANFGQIHIFGAILRQNFGRFHIFWAILPPKIFSMPTQTSLSLPFLFLETNRKVENK